MGQKVNPIGIRLGFIRKTNSFWYPDGNTFANILKCDLNVREFLLKKIPNSVGVGKILIERVSRNIKITINALKPGVIIGKKGRGIEKLKLQLNSAFGVLVVINVEEIKEPDLNALLVARNMAIQIQRRVNHKRVMKKVVSSAMKQGAKGVKVALSGRLGGIDIARCEWIKEGRIPLHTLKANIDYGLSEARTAFGVVGIKVWIYKSDIILNKRKT